MKTPPICANWLIPILVCTFGLAASTLVTYSQDNQTPLKGAEVAGITLPAENVEIADIRGRTITVTVTGRDANGITILMADGNEHHLPWNRLSQATVDMIHGRPPAKKSLQLQAIEGRSKRIREAMMPGETVVEYTSRLSKEASQAHKQIQHLSAKELQEAYLAKDPLVMQAASYAIFLWERDEARGATFNDPGRIGFHNRVCEDYIRTLEIKDPSVEEIVSLREEFKKLGVRATQQVGGTCAFHSVYNMLQYAALKDGGTPPSLKRFHDAARQKVPGKHGNMHPTYSLPAIKNVYGKRATVMSLNTGISKLTEEALKQELRNGRPVRATSKYRNSFALHHILVIGFHTKDGKTRYEYLDSNLLPTENNSGYAFLPNDYMGAISWDQIMFSIEFK
jgi:hypothetical protein